MNKKLIAIVLAALPVVAMADVTLYGDLKGSVESNSLTNGKTQGGMNDDYSYVGFKGTEDLGNGLKTVWQVESGLAIDGSGTSAGNLASRQTFVGLDGGNLGTVRIGNLDNFFQDQEAVDQWQYRADVGHNSATGLGMFAASQGWVKNAIRYDTATFAGLNAGVLYGFGENANYNKSNLATQSSSSILGLGLNYSYNDALSAHYAMQREMNPAGTTASTAQVTGNNGQAATKQIAEVDYSANNLFLSAAYQWATGYDWVDYFSGDGGNSTLSTTSYIAGDTSAGAQLKARQAAVSAAYTIGAFTPKVSYAKGWDLKDSAGTIANSGYRQYVFGVDYAMSKRTTAGVAYGNVNYGAGTSVAVANGANSDVTLKTIALTMAHSF